VNTVTLWTWRRLSKTGYALRGDKL